MRIQDIKVQNTGNSLPEYFYVFPNRNNHNLLNQIEQYNIELRNGTLVSSGMSKIYNPETMNAFCKGDMEYAPFIPNESVSIGSISPFLNRLVERYRLEYNLELHRKKYFKTAPSRFSCIYAFGSWNDCLDLASKKGWNIKTVRKYRLRDLGSMNNCIKVAKTNFKMIGFLEHYPFYFLSPENQYVLYHHYWSGEGSLHLPEIKLSDKIIIPEKGCGALYEYLIEGILEEVND